MSLKTRLALYKKRLRKRIEVIEEIERREEEGKKLLRQALEMVGRVTRQEMLGTSTYWVSQAFLGKAQEGSLEAFREAAADAKLAKYKFPHVLTTFHSWQVTEENPNMLVRVCYADTYLYYYFVRFVGEGFNCKIVDDGLLAALPKVKDNR